MNKPTTHEYEIESCDCREGNFRGKVMTFLERDADGWVRCRECGTVPNSIGHPIPLDHAVRLTVRHEDSHGGVSYYKERIYPEE